MVFRSFYLKSQKREVKQTMEMGLSICPHIQNCSHRRNCKGGLGICHRNELKCAPHHSHQRQINTWSLVEKSPCHLRVGTADSLVLVSVASTRFLRKNTFVVKSNIEELHSLYEPYAFLTLHGTVHTPKVILLCVNKIKWGNLPIPFPCF